MLIFCDLLSVYLIQPFVCILWIKFSRLKQCPTKSWLHDCNPHEDSVARPCTFNNVLNSDLSPGQSFLKFNYQMLSWDLVSALKSSVVLIDVLKFLFKLWNSIWILKFVISPEHEKNPYLGIIGKYYLCVRLKGLQNLLVYLDQFSLFFLRNVVEWYLRS